LKTGKVILAAVLFFFCANPAAFAEIPDCPECTGEAAVLMDGSSGRVLYEKDSHRKLPMASTTKIMTAITALEYGKPEDIVVIPPEASGVEGSSIWLSPGEHQTLKDLLYGLMLRSGNDAATAIALHIGGSVENFADMMNALARKIGAVDSSFLNPHGLPDDNHYTTAYDLARITAYGLKSPGFREIVSTKYHTIPWEGHEWDRAMKNENKLLWNYEGANGVKTGYTKKAGRCFVGSAKRDQLQLIAVVLNCGPMFEESAALLDYGFENYKKYDIYNKGDRIRTVSVDKGKCSEVSLVAGKGYAIALKPGEKEKLHMETVLPESVKAPLIAGKKAGTVKIFLGDHLMGSIPVVAAKNVEKQNFWDLFRRMVNIWR